MKQLFTTIALMLMPITAYAFDFFSSAWLQERIINIFETLIATGAFFLLLYILRKIYFYLKPSSPIFLQRFFAFMDKVFLTPLVSFCTRYSVKILFSLSLFLISPLFYAVTTPSAFTIPEASINSIFDIIEIFAVGLFIFFLIQKRQDKLRDLHELTQAIMAYDQKKYYRAFVKMKPVAEKGNFFAQNYLGVMYRRGLGVSQDDVEGVKWYRKSAEQGYAVAQCNLGIMYELEKGGAKDEKEALKWYREASGQGYAKGHYLLGEAYSKGIGVKKDEEEAVKYFRMAAEQGNADAQCTLGYAYESGGGVSKDEEEMEKWYRKAAEQGNAMAQYNLGAMHSRKKGVGLPNNITIYKWYFISKINGFHEAQEILDKFVKVMTPEDIEKAEKLAQRCIDSDYKCCEDGE